MKILITGVAGFIGSNMARRFLSQGHDVVGIDNFDPFYDVEVKKFNLELIYSLKRGSSNSDVERIAKILGIESRDRVGGFKFLELDIRNQQSISELFHNEKFDVVIHLAAMAGVPHSLEYPILYTDVNVVGTVNLIDSAVKTAVGKFIFASSSSVYGNCLEDKFSEKLDTDLCISPYAASKKMGEIMNYTFHKLHGIKVANVRVFTVYGPLQRPYGMAIQKFIKQAYHNHKLTVYGDGSMMRDFTYIEDLIDGFSSLLERDFEYLTINLGNNQPVSVQYLAELAIKLVGKGEIEYLPSPPTEVERTSADISLAQNLLGFNPKYSIEEGMRKQVEVFMAMPDWFKNLEN
jgi:UDP-glucuronate 4-epimerase